MNIERIPLDQISVEGRLRPVDPDYAELIGANMAERGQMTPIEVRATPRGALPYVLVAGAHRVAGAKAALMTEIQAVVFTGTALEAELREIDENLVRHELKELDRAVFLARRKEVYEKLHPETRHGGDRSEGASRQFGNLLARFTADAAQRVNLSERTIQRAIQRYGRLDPIARDDIAGLWIADHGAQLDALAKLPPGLQRQVAQVLRDNPTLRQVGAAQALAEGRTTPPTDPNEVQFDAFLRLWRRMPAAVRARVRTHVQQQTEGN